nr:ATP-binding cassette domain-containing protein [Vibrio furnissii]
MAKSPSSLEFRNISKHFPGVKALSNISFRANAGSIHALMGENGAGKSTLLKTLSGLHQPTEGHIAIDGQELSLTNTTDALNQGIAIIYQELNLVPELSVAENIFLGNSRPKTAAWIPKPSIVRPASNCCVWARISTRHVR